MELPKLALAVRQPWAWALIYAGKGVENRSPLAISKGDMKPGRIAILASIGMTRAEYDSARRFMENIGVTCPAPADLVRGAVIGAVTVDRIVTTSTSPWWMGPRGLVCHEAAACEPIPTSGKLGYFEWQPSGGQICEPALWMRPKAPTLLEPAAAPPIAGAPDLFGTGNR